jgi:hypothetical protein
MLIPARIITASWLVKFWMSLALGPNEMLKFSDDFLPARRRPSG